MSTDHPTSRTQTEARGPLAWFTSSYSNGAGGECVECAFAPGRSVLIRDSKVAHGPVLTAAADVWGDFIEGLKAT